MKYCIAAIILLSISNSTVQSQSRQYEIHRRGMLHQTVYNTGELGRAYDNGSSGSTANIPSFEWPGNSAMRIDGIYYDGQYNSFGGGIYLLGYRNDTSFADLCGAVSNNIGNSVPVVGVFSDPISIQRIENFPVLASGELNPAFNPDEAEEIIISRWKAINTGMIVTRTSRAWSYPDYDDFIIYEYEIWNPGPDTLKDAIISIGYSLCTSMFGHERQYNRWWESDTRAKDEFARYDFKRFMTYNHNRDGMPDPSHFNEWSPAARYGGGLTSPQAAGIVSLYYEYNQLAQLRWPTTTPQLWTRAYFDSDQYQYIFEDLPDPPPLDGRGRMKQPYINRYENGNLYPTKLGVNGFLDCRVGRKSTPFGATASSYPSVGLYWRGRAQPSWTIGSRQPATHIYGFGPYNILPDSTLRFTIAEVAGYGPGVAGDSMYTDLGGGCGSDGTDPDPGTHPVPSWYKEINYPEAKTSGSVGSNMGSNYLQTYPLPSYINSDVISIRNVADRAIQMYKGGPVVNYDTINVNGCGYEPKNSPMTGIYQVPIPVPAPVFHVASVVDTIHPAGANRITWGPQVESFSTPRLHAPLSHYEVLRADHPLSMWTRIDSVGKHDPRYFDGSEYVLYDNSYGYGTTYYYAIVSVDTLGSKSGLTNQTKHQTITDVENEIMNKNTPRQFSLQQNFPNPFNPTTTITYQLPSKTKVRLEVFNLLGQCVVTLVDAEQQAGTHQIPFDATTISSGIYFYRLSAEKFVKSQKMLLMR